MDRARCYGGVHCLDSKELAISFDEILHDCSSDDPYLTYYSGGRCLSKYSFNAFVEETESVLKKILDIHTVMAGDRVIVKAGNTDTALFVFSAVLKLRAVVVPVSPDISDVDLTDIAKASNAALVISDSRNFDDCIALETEKLFVTSLAKASRNQHDVLEEAELPALQVFTSGTTSQSKSVTLSLRNLIANAIAVTKHHDLGPSITLMSVLPLFHVNAFNLSFFATLFSKSQLILNRSFYLPSFWQIADTEQVSVISLVPKLIKILIEDRRTISPPKTLKYVISAAAPLPRENAQRFYDRFRIKVLQGYGMSEAVNFSLTTPSDLSDKDYAHLLALPDLTSGVELYGNHLAIKDEAGEDVGEGVLGELCIQGWNVMRGYNNNPKANREAFLKDHFKSGDIAYLRVINDQRYFFLKGRRKEIIIRNGENINPYVFEQKLRALDHLSEAILVGFENDYSGEGLGLVLPRALSEISTRDLMNKVKDDLGGQYVPDAIAFTDEVSYTDTGKLQRNKLRVHFSEYRTLPIG